MGVRIGVDIGGSFTDFVAFDEGSGRLAPHEGVLASRSARPGGDRGHAPAEPACTASGQQDVTYFTHGTTVGVNAVIQRKGPRLALFTTRNFEDVLEMARLKIADMYNLLSRRPPVLIPREHVFGVPERIGPDGTILKQLDEAERSRRSVRALAAGCEGVVIAFLHAWRNPAHEQRMRDDRAAHRARPSCVLLQRGLADHPRIRTHHHRRRQRLRAAAHFATT